MYTKEELKKIKEALDFYHRTQPMSLKGKHLQTARDKTNKALR